MENSQAKPRRYISRLKVISHFPQVKLDPVNASLASPFLRRLKHQVDVILFNPPYVPTDEEEALAGQDKRDIEGSWAGGKDGMQVTEQFLRSVPVSYGLKRCSMIQADNR
jgi:methylase of polypeptide subunit release factors